MGDAGYPKVVRIILTEAARLYTIIRDYIDLCRHTFDTNSICAENVRRNEEQYDKL